MLASSVRNIGGYDFPSVPKRSQLFHLEPIKVGQFDVESLASYIQRLIEAHHVDFEYLIEHAIRPNMGALKKEVDFFSPQSVVNTGWMIEGLTGHYQMPELGKLYANRHRRATRKFIQVLEELTLRANLNRLTLLPLEKIASPSGLIRRTLAWCPDCLSDWWENNQPRYYPLLWSIKNVVVCPKHKQVLRQICPNCEQYQQLLPFKGKLGYCSICREWLGRSLESPPHHAIRELKIQKELELHLWVAKSIGELLAVTSRSQKVVIKTNLKKSILRNIQNLKVSRYQLMHRDQQERCLNLDGLLKMCNSTNVTLINLLLM